MDVRIFVLCPCGKFMRGTRGEKGKGYFKRGKERNHKCSKEEGEEK